MERIFFQFRLLRYLTVVGVFCAGFTAVIAATAGGIAVEVENRSEPVLCAEKDNVTLNIKSPEVLSFRIEATHPAYIGSLQADRTAADFTACDMREDPAFHASRPAQRITLFETNDVRLIGYTFPTFWRPGDVPFKVGERIERGLHMVQLWVHANGRLEEILVLYPPDGYWRARPLPPDHMRSTSYGSSFLIGPIEIKDRPVVEIKEISFDPGTTTFLLGFVDGGTARMTVSAIDTDKQVIDVSFDKPVSNAPFAALRSMYVTEFNADAARIATRGPQQPGWIEQPIMAFTKADATDIWTGRLVPSRHNTSAPDIIFNGFSRTITPTGRPVSSAQGNSTGSVDQR
ncbi:hypothetical protein [Pseudomonas sp. DSP3-2-2]|uniref:hypothetical protein n=1 Tax=unclassified Pseudomonas TaxID=196821 RepID=UPI003CF5C539